ncbi:MAG: hypothetical protein K9H62_23090 [Bacteroidales bacterium]|nr:hypothetical protein [Bacteroidales bacterium]
MDKHTLVKEIMNTLLTGDKITRLQVEKLAKSYGLVNKNEIKELSELALVLAARTIAHENVPLKQRYNRIVQLYKDQMNISFRTSMSMMLQQFSTPAPISFLASTYIKSDAPKSIHSAPELYFEPSAGNGLLTIALDPQKVIVNEMDDIRYDNLLQQPFHKATRGDGSIPFPEYYHKMDGAITNPPFGNIGMTVIDRFRIYRLEHLMSIRALDTIKDSGKAAIIIGGHTHYDPKGRIKAGQNRYFLNYLHYYYHVDDVINIDGSKLYSRQGTAMDVRLILINGRKKTAGGSAPLEAYTNTEVMLSWSQLWDRVGLYDKPTSNEKAKARAKAIALKF